MLDAALRYTDEIGMTVYTSDGQALTIDRTNRDTVGQMLLDTYEYQACEAPGWDTSTAKAFCEGLRNAVIPALPGYTDAPWEITTTSTPAPTIY